MSLVMDEPMGMEASSAGVPAPIGTGEPHASVPVFHLTPTVRVHPGRRYSGVILMRENFIVEECTHRHACREEAMDCARPRAFGYALLAAVRWVGGVDEP